MSSEIFDSRQGIADTRTTHWTALALLLSLGILIGLALLQSQGTGDEGRWLIYMGTAREHGVRALYRILTIDGVADGVHTDYPPFAILLLGCLARGGQLLGISDFIVLKLSLLFFTLACAAVMTAWRGPLFGIAIYLVLFVDAMLLSYLDVYFVFTFLLVLWCMERNKLTAAALLFAMSFLTKWQPIILAPLLLLYMVPWPVRVANLLRFAPAALIVILVYAVFGNTLFVAFARGTADQVLSGKALNIDWLITALSQAGGLPSNDGAVETIYLGTYPEGIFKQLAVASSALRYVCYLVVVCDFFVSRRSMNDFVRASILGFLSYFMFGSGVHENHACLPAVLALCWMSMDRARYLEAVLIAGMFNINLVVFFGFSGKGLPFSHVLGGLDISILLALFNLVIFGLLWLPAARRVFIYLQKIAFAGTPAAATSLSRALTDDLA